MSDHQVTPEARHPIRVVARRTGLSPDVLRAWERRHAVVTPGRSAAGQRLSSDDDVERLSLLARAVGAGRSVSHTASLSLTELRQLVAEDAERAATQSTPAGQFLERAGVAVADLAPDRLERVLRSAALSLGIVAFLDDVAAPLLHSIGERWHAGEIGIAHEHAASAVVRGTMGWLVDAAEVPDDAPRVIMACLSGESHELGATLASAAAANAGWRVVYLGPDLPAAQIAAASVLHDAVVVGVSIVAPADAAGAHAELMALRKALRPWTALLAGGSAVRSIGPLGEGIVPVRDLAHWRTLLRRHAPAN